MNLVSLKVIAITMDPAAAQVPATVVDPPVVCLSHSFGFHSPLM